MNGHLRLRPHKCDLCMRSFSSKTVLQRHRLTHSAIRNFSCDVCDRKFTLKSDLTIHQRVHSGVRPYQCTADGCNKSFNLKTSYTRHLQTHSELHDYECTICVTAFRRKDNLERHIRNFHPETMVGGHPQQIVSIVQPKNFVPRKSSVTKGVSSRKTSKVDKNLDISPENIEPTSDNNQVGKNVMENGAREISSNDLVGSEVNEIQERESSSRLELPSFSKSVIVNTVKNTPETSDSLSSEGVSVISNNNKVVENSVKKVNPEQNISRKSSEPILPYRTITPPVQLSDNDRGNCVPTITKVTHIVHTSKTGIPNIETVITTRDVTKNKTKHMKESNEGVEKCGKRKNVVVEKPKRSKSVINYVPKSSGKTGGKKPVECFRILKPSSEFVTTCSSNLGRVSLPAATVTNNRTSVPNFEMFSPRKQQQMFTQEGTLANAFENLCQEILSEDTSRGASSNNRKARPGLDLASIRFNRAFIQQFGQPADSKVYENINPETPRLSNRLQSFNNMGMVSDSCLLADNALDHSITDPLYEQEISDSYSLHQMQNVVHNTADNSFIPPRDSYLESQQLYNYHNYDYDYQPNDNCFESYENHVNRGSNHVEEASMNRLGESSMNRFGEENLNGLGEGNFDRLDVGSMDRIGGDILNRFGVDNINRFGGDNMNTLEEHHMNRLVGDNMNTLGEDNMNRLGVDNINTLGEGNMNRLGEGSMNRIGEDDSNRLGVDNMNRPEGDRMNRLEELRMEYNRIEDQYNRLNDVPLVTRSVIVDQPKPPIIPACSGPRQLPLKKCLWTKSAFGNFLNDSAEIS
ncbi:RE1-silencing transcription factor [Nilaparvata lugens]|uniref:RE1-silencing transcription factor n=1 Tax=Nilaparvata lugens TaxID=108931 RepID=UPI00193D9D99|nr:RE1-silencing transcription factor [Nilaparvata lugens]